MSDENVGGTTPDGAEVAAAEEIAATEVEGKEAKGTAAKTVRTWPAVVLVIAMFGVRYGAMFIANLTPMQSMLSAMLPAALSILLVLWWLLFSRVAWRERFVGLAILFCVGIVAGLLADSTMVGFGMIVYLVPFGAFAFAVALIATGRSSYRMRMIAALIGCLVGFGFADLMRVDGMTGDFRSSWLWRWQLNGEERALAKMKARPESPSSEGESRTVDEPLTVVEWPGFRGMNRDANGPDVSLEEDWSAHPPKELWRIPVGPSWSSFSVAGRRLFTQEQRGENEAVVCYNAETGEQLWIYEYESRFWEAIGGAGPRATPTIDGVFVYTMGSKGVLLKLDAVNGDLVWRRDLEKDANREPPTWGFSSSPLVVGMTVIVHAGGKDDKGLLAYDTQTGDLKWGAPAGDHSYSSAQLSTLGGVTGVLMLGNDGLRMYDPESGSPLWNYEWELGGYRALQPLVLSPSQLLITTGMGIGTRRVDLTVDGETIQGEEAWTSRGMKTDYNDYVAHEGYLYGFDGNIFACIDLESGEQQWKRGRYGNGQVLLLPKSGQLIVLSEEGEVVLLNANPQKHDEVAKLKAMEGKTWNHPVVVGNKLFVRNGEEAVCYEMTLK